MKRCLCCICIMIICFSCFCVSYGETETVSLGNEQINPSLYDLSIEELLTLQSEISKVLTEKGYVQYIDLDRGSKGDEVVSLQKRLKELGYYQGNISGKYDTETQKAFKQFEKTNGLVNDGVASQDDQAILYSSDVIAKTMLNQNETTVTASAKTTPDPTPEGYLPFSDFDYTEYFRYPDKYYGTKIVLKGKVVQVIDSWSGECDIRLATSGSSDIVYVRIKFDPGFNILENDRLTVYATMRNTYTYISTFMSSITIPSADADSIKLN